MSAASVCDTVTNVATSVCLSGRCQPCCHDAEPLSAATTPTAATATAAAGTATTGAAAAAAAQLQQAKQTCKIRRVSRI